MTFAQGAATSHDNFVSALDTFLVTTDGSWTQDDLDLPNDEAAWHHTAGVNIHFSMTWNNTTLFNLFQALGFTGGNSPGAHPDDSGNGNTSTPDRVVDGIGAGPFVQHTFMSGSAPDYTHVIIEESSGVFRHFSFGELDKVGTWTGGEYVVGHKWVENGSADDDFMNTSHSILWDGLYTFDNDECGTVHVESLPDQVASGKWGVIYGNRTGAGNDTAAVARVDLVGGVRDGPLTTLGSVPASSINGFVPLIPIPIFYKNVTPAPDDWRLLGFVPDARVINITNFNPGDEITVGGDTWKVFPWVRKRFLQDNTQESGNAGIAYKKNV